MTITDVKIRKVFSEADRNSKLLALVSVTIDNELALHDLKIIRTAERTFLAMPSRRDESGVYHDIFHPISSQVRQKLEEVVFEAYHNHLEFLKSNPEPQQGTEPENPEQL